MRKEYTLNSFIPDFFTSIDDFFSNFTVLYSLVDSQSDRRVYKNLKYDLYLMFYSFKSSTIVLLVSTEYDSSKEVWYQRDVVCSGYSKAISDINLDSNPPWNVQNVAYYFPAPSLMYGNKLVANYNSENDTFMFSVIRDTPLAYSIGTHIAHRTYNLVFGDTSKYLDFVGGFFYGTDNMHTFERYYREKIFIGGSSDRVYLGDGTYEIYDSNFKNISFHIRPMPLDPVPNWKYPWVNDPYNLIDCCFGGNMPNPDNNNNFEAVLFARIDNSPYREKDELVSTTVKTDITKFSVPEIRRSNIWAVTMQIGYYVKMVCSITKSSTPLPRYKPLLCNTYLHEGHTVNKLNNISILMPLWFMVLRDPGVLNNYSTVCRNDVINFVDMFNMGTNRVKNGTYLIEDFNYYDCFHMGSRRAMFGTLGYSGLAFKLNN